MFGRRLAVVLALALAGTALTACGKAAPAKHEVVPGARAGVVREVKGTVTATRPGAASRPLAAGDAVSGDDVIETGADGSVLIELDHNHVTFALNASKQQEVAASLAWSQPVAVAQTAAGTDEHSAAAGRAIERSAVDTSASSTESAPAPGAAAAVAPPPPTQAPRAPEADDGERDDEPKTAAIGAGNLEQRGGDSGGGGGGHTEAAKDVRTKGASPTDDVAAPTMATASADKPPEPPPPPPPPPPPDTGSSSGGAPGSPGPALTAGAPRVPPIATISTAGALSTADLGGQLEVDKIRACLGSATRAMLVVGTNGKIARVTTNGGSSATTCVRNVVKAVVLPMKHSQTTIKIVFPEP